MKKKISPRLVDYKARGIHCKLNRYLSNQRTGINQVKEEGWTGFSKVSEEQHCHDRHDGLVLLDFNMLCIDLFIGITFFELF